MLPDFTRQRVAQPQAGPDFAGTPTPLMQPSTLIDSVMAAHPQGGSGAGSALSLLGGAVAQRPQSVPAAPGGASEMGDAPMPQKRPPFQTLGPPMADLA